MADAAMRLSWPQALAWRMRRQLLDPVGAVSVADVVRRLGAVPAFPDHAAELAVGVRRDRSRRGDGARALAAGQIIKTYAFRGATHLFTPEEAGAYLALRAASRMWELPSWQTTYGLTPSDWSALREAVRTALADGPMSKEELGAAVTGRRQFRHLGFAFADRSDTFLKPLAWQGDISFGPPRDRRATFQRLDHNPGWAGLPDIDEAGMRAIEAYFRAYGPATTQHVCYWLGEGLGVPAKLLRSWIAAFGGALTTVEVDEESAFVLRDDLDDLSATPTTTAVRLLPAYDQWVLGPGTADAHIVPPASRSVVSRGANLLVVSGVVSGTWSAVRNEVVVTVFPGTASVPRDDLEAEVARLATILDRPLRLSI